MTLNKIKIGLLTSSRADYSIYRPLIELLTQVRHYELTIIAFGSHLSKLHGYTIKQIEEDGYEVPLKINTLSTATNTPYSISDNIGKVIKSFSKVWRDNHFDLVFCLGDRYEMFAAVVAGLPFNVNFAHLYGGETTLGAIDEALRHSITHMSKYHFTSCEQYKQRVESLVQSSSSVFNCGSLSYDNLSSIKLPSIRYLNQLTGLDFHHPTILTTFHPETKEYGRNIEHIQNLSLALSQLKHYNILITMPNNDTFNHPIKKEIQGLAKRHNNIKVIANMGTVNYLAAMKYCSLMLGNTSSGFVEASWFPTKVINLGERQNGRIITPNIINCPIKKDLILQTVEDIQKMPVPQNTRIYGSGKSAKCITSTLMQMLSVN